MCRARIVIFDSSEKPWPGSFFFFNCCLLHISDPIIYCSWNHLSTLFPLAGWDEYLNTQSDYNKLTHIYRWFCCDLWARGAPDELLHSLSLSYRNWGCNKKPTHLHTHTQHLQKRHETKTNLRTDARTCTAIHHHFPEVLSRWYKQQEDKRKFFLVIDCGCFAAMPQQQNGWFSLSPFHSNHVCATFDSIALLPPPRWLCLHFFQFVCQLAELHTNHWMDHTTDRCGEDRERTYWILLRIWINGQTQEFVDFLCRLSHRNHSLHGGSSMLVHVVLMLNRLRVTGTQI